MSVRRRLEHLEQRLGWSSPPEECGGLAQEIGVIDENIARLQAEIAEAEARMPPEEVQRMRLAHKADMAALEGLSLDEKIAALELEIAQLEAQSTEQETDEERSKRW